MPSLLVSDAALSETSKDKMEKKKMKNQTPVEEDGFSVKKKKDSKKRKALDTEIVADEDEEKSETSFELVEPDCSKSKSEKKKKKKAKLDEPEVEEIEVEKDPNAISNFRISALLRAKLKEKGIESLFPIQAMTFDTILDGSDLVGRARTGQVCSFLFLCWIFLNKCLCFVCQNLW